MIPGEQIKELTYEERATWGECPVCKAPCGEWCHPEVGIQIGHTITGEPPSKGVHLGRLKKAPSAVKITPIY